MALIPFPVLTRSAPRDLNFSLISNTTAFRSPLTKSLQTLELPGAAWQASFSFNNLGEADAAQLQAFLMRMRGSAGRVQLYNWARPRPRGIATGTPLVRGSGQTGAALITDGWTPSTTDILKVGDFIGINGELKMVVADANSDAGGVATLSIEPPLRSSPFDNAAIVTNKPTATFQRDDDAASWSTAPALISSFALQLIEAF